MNETFILFESDQCSIEMPQHDEGGIPQMDALEAIRRRRSVRKYTGGSIPRADLEKIVDA